MGFWIFMMIMDLLIPITMIGFGKYFSEKAPREINNTFGYRTSMSMKNKDTWDFAHHYFGKLWVKMGYVVLIISIIGMLFLLKKDENTIGLWGGVLCAVQLVFMILPIIFTEKALKKNFDKYGNKVL
ncbi:SdpI family protein [Clostridium sp. LIBA-8841]|uniref:SdpI family protein n=1 Tax=Clostridium sp. LIBA-8841 TaxID=2987530 RepID=UPI002AC770E4|nr:SdpI family protein [Clostridium sp. LIBA-8841]MDZ5253793.1 SdpI family protein [Clostridium sp. LIBA-8841]